VPVVDGIVGLYAETLQFANRKMTEVKGALDKSTESYEAHDQAGATAVTSAGAGVGGSAG